MCLQVTGTYGVVGELTSVQYDESVLETGPGMIDYIHLSDQISVPNINTCGGTVFCTSGTQDSLDLGLKLEERFHNIYLHTKLSIAVSGCSNKCTKMCINDIGIIGKEDGWDMIVGGSDCHEPNYPWKIASSLSVPEVLEMLDRIIALFRLNQSYNKKLSTFIEGVGFENFKEEVYATAEQDESASCTHAQCAL